MNTILNNFLVTGKINNLDTTITSNIISVEVPSSLLSISKLANKFSNKLVIMKDRKTNEEKRFMFNFWTIGGYPNLVYPDRIQKDDLEICKKALSKIL